MLISGNAAYFRLFQVELGAKEATCNREVDNPEISTNHLPIHSRAILTDYFYILVLGNVWTSKCATTHSSVWLTTVFMKHH